MLARSARLIGAHRRLTSALSLIDQRNVMLSVSRVTLETLASCLTGYLSTTQDRKARGVGGPASADRYGSAIPASGSSDADQNGKDRWMIDRTADIEPQKPELTDDDFFICRNTTIAFSLDQEGVGPQGQNLVAQRH